MSFDFLVHFASPLATVALAASAGFGLLGPGPGMVASSTSRTSNVDADYIHYLFQALVL